MGAAALLLLAGRTDRPTALAWQRGLGRFSALAAAVAVLAGIVALAHQTAVVSGWSGAALQPSAVADVLLETQSGRVWLARHGLLLLIAVFALLAPRAIASVDWLAVRGEALLLAALALALLAVAGHAAAVSPSAAGGLLGPRAAALVADGAVFVDALHVLATGIWVGGLWPLAALLARASREEGADARPYAVLAARRFSRTALACVLMLAVTGAVNTLVQVGGVPALIGTPYGRLLLLKLVLLVPILLIAAGNRRLIPRLSGEAVGVGRPAMRALGRFVGVEAACAAALLLVVAVLSVTPPGRHAQPDWPLPFRLTSAALESTPELRGQVLIGSQIIVLGVVVGLCAAFLGKRRLVAVVGALTLSALGAGLMLPPLAVDAYPTTYQRPAVPYQAASIVEGAALYRTHCAACHGVAGAGDGPARPALPRPPADLRAEHTGQHTAGDIFWWITSGIPAARMPAFGQALDPEQRWDLVNFVRALGAGAAARRLDATVSPPALVAPDFAFAVGPTPPRSLKEYRGRRIVLLVLYTLPASRQRLTELAQQHGALGLRGVEIIAIPRDAAADAIRRLGDEPRILYPVVTDGARDIVTTYDLLAPGDHAELVVDRQGYLRARWIGPADPDQVLAAVDRLNTEPAGRPVADDHAH